MGQTLSLIVLAYNDGASLRLLLPRIYQTLRQLSLADYEILVVDDGSTDDTQAVVRAFSHVCNSTRLIVHPHNMGVGAAFRSGVEQARHVLIGYIDGDGQYDPRDFTALLERLPVGGAASGRRLRRADSIARRPVSRLYGLLLSSLYGLSLQDTNSGLKLYSQEFLAPIQPLRSDGAFFDAEVMIKGIGAGGRVVEVPVSHYPRHFGRSGGLNVMNIVSAIKGLSGSHMRVHARNGMASGFIRRFFGGMATNMRLLTRIRPR